MDRTRRLAMVEEDARKEVRWSASRKADAVMRLLRGEDLDEVSRELRVEAHRLAAWRDEFMAGALEGLKARPLAPEDRRVKEAERRIGELTLENEILQAAVRKRWHVEGQGRRRRGTTSAQVRDHPQKLERFHRQEDVAFALEGTTGWLYVVEELHRAGIRPHLAEPADTAALRGRKRRAKTDAADAKLLRELLLTGRLPESWIPPAHVEQIRTLVRLRKALLDERRAWHQRLQAKLFHHGLPRLGELSPEDRREWFGRLQLDRKSTRLNSSH